MKGISITLISILIFFMCGCAGIHNQVDSTIHNTVHYLSSEKLNGRLAGDVGNNHAVDYVKEFFAEINLDNYNDNYFAGYEHKAIDQTYTLTFDTDNRTIETVYGIDYIPLNNVANINITAKVTSNLDQSDLSGYFVLVNNQQELQKVYREAKGILIKNNILKKHLTVSFNQVPIVQISQDLYNRLKKLEGMDVTYTSEMIENNIVAYNVIGNIPGKDNTNALVLSAHLDHVGSIGSNLFPGAIDNSTGIAILLDLAKNLKDYSMKNKLPYDVVFCAFNGEELDQQGSKAYAKEICSNYDKVILMNFDCIGVKGESKIKLLSNLDIEFGLTDSLSSWFNKEGIAFDIDHGQGLVSDHVSFAALNIPAVSIGQNPANILHTSEDTIEMVDFEYLKNVSCSIFKYIKSIDSENDFKRLLSSPDREPQLPDTHREEYSEEHSHDDELIKAQLESEMTKLKLNQYKKVQIGDKIYSLQKNNDVYKNIESLKSAFPSINIPTTINGYSFNIATLVISNKLEDFNGGKKYEVGEVYDGESFTANDIQFLSVSYMNSENKTYEIMIRKVQEDKDALEYSLFTPEDAKSRSIAKENIIIENRLYELYYSEINQVIAGAQTLFDNRKYGAYYVYVNHTERIVDNVEKPFNKIIWVYETPEKSAEAIKSMNVETILEGIFR